MVTHNFENFTREQFLQCERNRRRLKKLLDVPKGFVLHHRDPELRRKDIDRYIEWRPGDVIIISKAEHNRIHLSKNTGRGYTQEN